MTDTVSTNRYLAGNYAPVSDELTVYDLPVDGTIPAELRGRFVRNGPNPITSPNPDTYHWFTGTGMLHGVRIEDGRATWYRNRWLRSADVTAALGEAQKGGPIFEGMDFAANTNVIGHAGRTLAIVEGGTRPYEVDDLLESIGPTDFGATLPGGFTAHPKLDPATGELHAMAYWWGWGNRVQYIVVGTDGRVRETRFVDTHGSPMMHDMSLTERFAVAFDLPVAFDMDAAMAGARFPYYWQQDYPARFGLVPRDGGDVRWVDIDPCYVFHPMNAFDDGDQLVIDAIRWQRMFDRRDDNGPLGRTPPTLTRWTIDTVTATARETTLDDHDQEFPRINETLTGRRHRYGYAAVNLGDDRGGIIKHDLGNGSSETVDFGPGSGNGANEAVFIPAGAAGDGAEDDGWLMSIIYDASDDTSSLVILAAQDIAAGPVATVHLPRRVPFGFHGNWLPDTRPS